MKGKRCEEERRKKHLKGRVGGGKETEAFERKKVRGGKETEAFERKGLRGEKETKAFGTKGEEERR